MSMNVELSLHAVIKCNDVELLENRDFSYTNESRVVGTIVTYKCDAGFYLNGISMRTCTLDKTWVPTPSPTCGESLYFVCGAVLTYCLAQLTWL